MHQERITIPADRWARWLEAAQRCGDVAVALQKELAEARREPTRPRLDRAAQAAR
jgi:hypothetical protein